MDVLLRGVTGGQRLEDLRTQWREAYDLVLIDSRTGLTDGGGVCTVQMPDALVLVFTANTQCLEDGLAFVRGVDRARAAFAFERAPLTIVPVLARWDGGEEVDLADAWLGRMEPLVAPLVGTWLPAGVPVRRLLERLRVPHVARFSFGESLPVLTHSLSDPDRPGLAYDLLAELLANGFSEAGRIIEPGYQPPFDPIGATDDEIAALLRDDLAREAALHEVVERYGTRSSITAGMLIRLAEGGARIGRLALADVMIQRAVSIARERLVAAPSDAVARKTLSTALLLQGDVRRAQGRLAEAMLGFQEALETSRALAAGLSTPDWQHDVSVSLNAVGRVLEAQGNLKRALSAYEESLALARRLAAADPSNATWQRDVSIVLEMVGRVLEAQGNQKRALSAYEESLAVARRLAEADPSNPEWQRGLLFSLAQLAELYEQQGDIAAGLPLAEEILSMDHRLRALGLADATWREDKAVSRSPTERLRGRLH
jgi:tetratricopeptide (TPR) repeat protein